MTKQPTPLSKKKTIAVYISTIFVGYLLFILPDVFFGVTKLNGGKIGINLLMIGLFQLITIGLLLKYSLKVLGKELPYIGLRSDNLFKDSMLGLLFGGAWTAFQFLYLIPQTGGASRPDISGMLTMYDGSLIGLLSFIGLGVIGGGITEELFNRGYFINVLKDVFKNKTAGTWFASLLSILLFCLGHLPSGVMDWIDILTPTLIYTLLFLTTNRLTASMVAHGVYNLSAIVLVYHLYY